MNATTTIAIANQKGGVGKTTTTVNLASALHESGYHVLCVDFDPQSNLTSYLGHQFDNRPTISDFMFARATFHPLADTSDAIRTAESGIDYIPSSLSLSKAESVLAQAMFRERLLKDVLSSIVPAGRYDFILIDCNPSMGVLLTNALVAATDVLIPVQTEEFAVGGLKDMLEIIDIVKTQINEPLKVIGLLPTMVAKNTVSRRVLSDLQCEYPDMLLSATISRSVEAAKSSERKMPLAASSKLGGQYHRAMEEIVGRLNNTAKEGEV